MDPAVREFVNDRLIPIENQVGQLMPMREDMEELKTKVLARDADLKAAEKRFEEIAVQVFDFVKELKALKSKMPETEQQDPDGRRSRSILNNPAFRNVDAYAGDHSKFSKFRS